MFHPILAPYRIDMVNELSAHFDLSVCLYANNLQGQKFNIAQLYKERLAVEPEFLLEKKYDGKPNIPRAIVDSLNKHNPNVVLVSEFNLYVWVVLLYRIIHKAKFKVVSLVDDCLDMLEHTTSVFVWHALSRKITIPYLDQVIVVDHRAADWYQRKYGKGTYFPLVSNELIYRDRLQRVIPISEEYVRRFHLQGKKVLLFVGRLSAEKNLPTAITAFLTVKREDEVFVVVGDGPEREALKLRYGNSENVMFVGRYESDELYAWYNVGQVLILPSTRETFGAVTNEALMAGCRVLLSDVAGSGCLIEDGKNGDFISPIDCDGMSKKITQALSFLSPVQLPLRVRPNRMPQSYQDYVTNLVQTIQTV